MNRHPSERPFDLSSACDPVARPLSARQAAAAIGVSLPTFRALLAAGRGPRVFRAGHRIKITPEALADYIAESEAEFAASRSAAA
jgi:hypothetical protein